jgi:hypothetical protein
MAFLLRRSSLQARIFRNIGQREMAAADSRGATGTARLAVAAIAGLYPAARAARLPPTEALRSGD